MTLDTTELARQVRDALGNLYDPTHLQMHPLVELLEPPRAPGESAGEALRHLLRDVIESLRPAATLSATRPEWLGYRILLLYYVRLLDQEQVCRELSLSEATFYRRLRDAVEAVCSVLWDRYLRLRGEGESPGASVPATADALARDQAICLAETTPREAMHLASLLAGVQRTLAPLADQRGVHLTIDLPQSLPSIQAVPAVLRQILIDLGVRCAPLAAQGALVLGAHTVLGSMVFCFRGLTQEACQQVLEGVADGLTTDLVEASGGELYVQREGSESGAICLRWPMGQPHRVLIVEDDPRTVDLYRRYLQDQGCTVLGANGPEQVEAQLAHDLPDLILLDVMLSQSDGWVVLQHLKERPDTAAIPVIVCSVLEQPQLALALGAAAVLKKPIAPDLLQRTVQDCLTRLGSSA
jgi:CheY-like chemotaxis protein